QLLDAGEAHRLEQVVGDDGAALEIEVGVGGAEADVAVRGEVPDAIGLDLLKQGGDALALQQIELVKVKVRRGGRAGDVLAFAEEVVVDAVDLVALAEEAREEVG